MPIPLLNEMGVLPPGIHDCLLDEVEDCFGSFKRTDQRIRLFKKLQAYFAEIKGTELAAAVIIDGSFVTSQEVPNDIDLILVLKAGHDFQASLRPFEYNVVSRRRVRTQFGFDLVTAVDGGQELRDYIQFFSQVRDRADVSKGLLRVLV